MPISNPLNVWWFVRAALACAILAVTTGPADAQYTWNLTGGGEWLQESSWTPAGGPPNAVGATASFGNSITASSAVTITGAATVGEINFTGITGSKAYTIGASGNTITLSNGASAAILSASSTLTSSGTQLINSNLAVTAGSAFSANIDAGTIHVAGSVSGSAGLTKTGAGTLILSGNNTGLTGGITVNSGVLEVRGRTNSPAVSGMGANAVTVSAGGQLRVVATDFWEPSNLLTIAGNGPSSSPLYKDAALWFDSFSPTYHRGPIALSADASLRLDGAFLFGGTSSELLLNGHVARFTGEVGTVGGVDGSISDGSAAGGRVVIDINGGNVSFFKNSTYTGTTTINRGTLYIHNANSLGQGLGTVANRVIVNDSGGFFGKGELYLNGLTGYTVSNKLLTLNGGLLVCNGGSKGWTGAINLTANSTIGAEGINGNLTISGGIDLSNRTLTLRPNFNDSVININTNGITGTGSVIIIPVTGQGTVNLNATSTYSGTTTIQAHRVYANATQSTGTGAVTVSGGSLRGVGSILGAVTVSSGSIAPGGASATGTLTLDGGVSFSSSSKFTVRVNSSSSFDSAFVTGTTVLGNALLEVDLTGAGSSFTAGTDKLYVLRMASGNSLQAGTTFNVAHGGYVGSTSLYNFFAYYDYAQGGGVYLTPYPVPEPGSVLAVSSLALGVVGLRRRKSRRGASLQGLETAGEPAV